MNRTILKILCLLFPIVIYLFPAVAYAAGEVTDCSSQKELQDKINQGPGLITFNCVLGTNVIPVSGSQLGVTNYDVTLDGRMADGRFITLQGQGNLRILNVEEGRKLTLTNITVAGGFASTTSAGGSIRVNKATVTVISSTIRDSKAGRGAGVFLVSSNFILSGSNVIANIATDTDGGGILVTGNSAVTVTNSSISDNTASKGHGAGIAVIPVFSENSSLSVENGTFSNNQSLSAAAIYVDRSGSGKTSFTIMGNKTIFDKNSAINGNGGALGIKIREKGVLEMTLSGGTFSNNKSPQGSGGGFAMSSADTAQSSLSLSNMTVYNNEVANNGGGLAFDVSGGNSTIHFEKMTISNNRALNGGGIAVDGRTNSKLFINNSTLSNNSATKEGGGLYLNTLVSAGTTTISMTNSTVNGNSALSGDGGGLRMAGKSDSLALTVLNSTFQGNQTNLYTDAGDGDGGGLSFSKGTATLINMTIANNTAKNRGGGMRVEGSGVVTIQNTILASNVAEQKGQDCHLLVGLMNLFSSGYNIVQSTQNCSIDFKTTDTIGKDPMLGSLANNGGDTQTMALLSGSPAIDGIKDSLAFCPPTDQRGKSRPIDGDNFLGSFGDIGAYEFMPYMLELTKAVNPTAVSPNGLLTTTLFYTVSGSRIARNVTLRDVIPANTTLQSQDSPGRDMGTAVVWTLGDLTPPKTGSVKMVVKTANLLPNGLEIINTATITSNDFLTPTSFATAKTTINSLTLVEVKKSVTPTIAEQDGFITYTINYTVSGNAPATNITLRDEVPLNTTFFEASAGPDGLPPTSQPMFGDGSGAVVWKVGNLLADIPKTGQVKMIVKAKTFFIGGAKIVNTVGITSVENPTPVQNSVTSTVNAPDLVIDKSTSSPVVFADGTVTYTIIVNNKGTLAASGIKITDLLPEGFTYRATQSITWTATASRTEMVAPVSESSQPFWGNWTLSPGGKVTIVFSARVSRTMKTGTYNNAVQVDSNEMTVLNDGTASKSENVLVNALPKLLIDKRTRTPDILAGGQAIYGFTIRNSSPFTLTNVTFSDTLPSGFIYRSTDNFDETSVIRLETSFPTLGMTDLVWRKWTFRPGGTINITFTVDVPKSVPTGLYNNSAYLTSDQTGQLYDDGDLNKDEDVLVSQKPLLYINKKTTTPIVAVGDIVTYTIALLNAGTTSATGVVISDILPSGFRYQDSSFEAISVTRLITVNPLVGDRMPVWRYWMIDPGGALTVTFSALVPENAPDYTYNNLAQANSYETGLVEDNPTMGGDKDTIPGQDSSDDEDVTVGYLPYLTLVQQVDSTVVGAGSLVHYEIMLSNIGTEKASGVKITTVLSDGFTFAGIVSIEENQSVRSVTNNPKIGDGTLVWDKWVIAPQGSIKITFFVKVATTLPENTYTSITTAESDTTAPLTARHDLTVRNIPVLLINKKTSTPAVLVGEVATYTVAIRNVGNISATGVVITDLLPSGGFTYRETSQIEEVLAYRDSISNPVDSNTPVWEGWTIEPDGALTLTFQVDVLNFTRAGTYNNTVQTSSNQTKPIDDDGMIGGDADTPPNEDQADDEDVTVTSMPILAIDQTTTTPKVEAGEWVTYTIEVRNRGTSNAIGVVITDILPNGFSYVATSNIQETSASRATLLNPTEGEISLKWGSWTIERNGRVLLTFMVKVADSVQTNSYDNVAWANSPDTGSVSDGESVAVTGQVIKTQKTYLPIIIKEVAITPTHTPTPTGTLPTPSHTPTPTHTPPTTVTPTPTTPFFAPDLVVERIDASPKQVQVVIRNQGNAPVPVGQEFWVDFYVNPNPPPQKVNQVWNDGRSNEGIAWGITDSALPLKVGGILILTYSTEAGSPNLYYWSQFTRFSGNFSAGTPVYVQVDSANLNTNYGGVLESHEIIGGFYNNISKGSFQTLSLTSGDSAVQTHEEALTTEENLPLRPTGE